jgi:phosphoglycolate phosphatase-like HAD superfamily hydrolase
MLARCKPNLGMILGLAHTLSGLLAQGILYIGDRPQEKQVACAAGAKLATAAHYFA